MHFPVSNYYIQSGAIEIKAFIWFQLYGYVDQTSFIIFIALLKCMQLIFLRYFLDFCL